MTCEKLIDQGAPQKTYFIKKARLYFFEFLRVLVVKAHILPSLIVFCGLIIAVSHPAVSYPQEKKFIRISGEVKDAVSGEPLPYANVFLSNTTIGAATDSHGHYLITAVPLGNYEIVASMMGYELETRPITIRQPIDRIINFELNMKVLESPGIEIQGTVPVEWKKNFEKFERIFLGDSKNARKCKILNPEYINFDYDYLNHALLASSDRPIEIENRALGYRVYFSLTEYSSQNYSSVRYFGYSRFVPLTPKNSSEEKRWEKNRFKAYRGSTRHFLASLFAGTHEQEGFVAFNVSDLREDITSSYSKRITSKEVLRPGPYPFEKILSFPDYLKVIYTGEGESKEFIYYAQENFTALLSRNRMATKIHRSNIQTSGMKLNYDSVVINNAGLVMNPYAITTFGYWGWEERFAELLPLDYVPKENKR